jgi:cell division protein FtsB
MKGFKKIINSIKGSNKPKEEEFDYNYSYEPEEDYNEEKEANEAVKKSLRGYRVLAILLTIILIGVSVLLININNKQKQTHKELEMYANATLHGMEDELNSMVAEYDSLKVKYDTLLTNHDGMSEEILKAREMIDQLKNERRLNYNTIKKYQKEVGTLRAVMKNYLRQIDSLNTINKKLSGENVNLRQEISSLNLRADKAEEQAKEYQNKVKQGSILHARDITLVALNANDKVISRVKNAAKLRVDFTIGANELAKAGNRPIYLCITSPDGYLLSTDAMPTFVYQGVKKGYSESREVDYQNEDVDVSIFYKGSGFIPGTYKIELYMDGNKVGGTEVAVK